MDDPPVIFGVGLVVILDLILLTAVIWEKVF